MASVGMPMLTRKVVRVNRPMWERWCPEERAVYRVLMQGGTASTFTVWGISSCWMVGFWAAN